PPCFSFWFCPGVYAETYLGIREKSATVMNYDISFNKKTAGMIFAGGILAGSLLFFSGYKIGLDRGAVRAKAEMEKLKDIPPVSVPSPSADTNNSAAAENLPQEPAVDSNPTSDSYSVQIGVFLTEDAARQLQRKFGGR